MKSSTFTFKDEFGVEIFTYKWEPDENKPKASIMVLPGLADHCGRYEELSNILTNNDYICYASDYRGHGKTAKDASKLGIIGPGKGEAIPSDILQLWTLMKSENPNIPGFVFGHDLGSILLQSFMQKNGEKIDGAILASTTGKQDMLQVVKLVVKSELKKIGYDGLTEKINDIILTSNNKPFEKDGSTPYEWISQDTTEIQKYMDNPYCGFVSSVGFYYELLFNPDYPWTKKKESKIPKNLPMLFLIGENDSLSNKTKKVKALIKRYKKNGIKDITYKSYPNARHELINELKEIRVVVFRDIINWLDSKV